MKKIGLIGGISWESTQMYYQLINQRTKELVGGKTSARILLESVNFSEISRLQYEDDWATLDAFMVSCAQNLLAAKADFALICANTMHLCYPAMTEKVDIPIIHIARETGKEIQKKGLSKVALLGTKFTMELDFYKGLLKDEFGIEAEVPDENGRELVNRVIYEELTNGLIREESKQAYLSIIDELTQQGAKGVILGCTEIPLLIQQKDLSLPVFDTTRIHAYAAVNRALGI